VALGFLTHNLLIWFQRDVFGDTGLGDLGLKRFVQDLMRLPASEHSTPRPCGSAKEEAITYPPAG